MHNHLLTGDRLRVQERYQILSSSGLGSRARRDSFGEEPALEFGDFAEAGEHWRDGDQVCLAAVDVYSCFDSF